MIGGNDMQSLICTYVKLPKNSYHNILTTTASMESSAASNATTVPPEGFSIEELCESIYIFHG